MSRNSKEFSIINPTGLEVINLEPFVSWEESTELHGSLPMASGIIGRAVPRDSLFLRVASLFWLFRYFILS